MNSKLRSLVVAIGVFILAGGGVYSVYRREPPGQPIANLRDAGLFSERDDRWVNCNAEKITVATRNHLRRNGYGEFRPGTVHRICRVVVEHWRDRPVHTQDQMGVLSDGGPALLDVVRPCESAESAILDGGWCRLREIVSPSLDVLANDADGGDEEDETDDALQFRTDDGYRLECNDDTDGGIRELNLLPDGGARHPVGGDPAVARPWCSSATRRGRVTPPCVIPDCWTLPDGGWDDNAVVDCAGSGPFGGMGGAPRWRGCNVLGTQYATALDGGTPSQCVPTECSIVAGDTIDVLR